MESIGQHNILVVDDNDVDRHTYRRYLNSKSNDQFDISEAEDGDTALKLLNRNTYNCILLDYALPQVTGLELLKKINTQKRFQHIPVIVLTGNGNEEIAVDFFKNGAADYAIKSSLNSETLLSKVKNAIEKQQLLNEIEKQKQQLHKLAYQDPLTGLLNRRSFEQSLDNTLSYAKRHAKTVALLLIDVDHFKSVNDSYGHQMGDELLVKIAEILRSCVRKEDLITRIGGDEFAIALTDIRHKFDAGRVAKKIIDLLSKPIVLGKVKVYIGASIGIATTSEKHLTDEALLLKYADIALYNAKNNGRNQYQFYSKTINRDYENRLKVEMALQTAIENNEFYLKYQPQYQLRNKKIIGIESLLRWNNPQLGEVPPNNFIHIADECGLINDIGCWVVEQSFKEFSNLFDVQHCPTVLAINVSTKQLFNDALINTIKQGLKQYNIKPDNIELEISESLFMNEMSKVKSNLDKLNQLGLKISIDDFGTGFSSLSLLNDKLPIDNLKIDRRFVQGLIEKSSNQMITKTIIDIAHNLDLDVVAKGVECQGHINFLLQNGCDKAQGFYLNKPLTMEQLTKLMS